MRPRRPFFRLAWLEPKNLEQMCQVSSSELRFVYPCADLGFNLVERALEWGVDSSEPRDCGGEAGSQEAGLEAREEQGCAKAERGDAITETVGQAFDQAV